jgi:hypothetical protein
LDRQKLGFEVLAGIQATRNLVAERSRLAVADGREVQPSVGANEVRCDALATAVHTGKRDLGTEVAGMGGLQRRLILLDGRRVAGGEKYRVATRRGWGSEWQHKNEKEKAETKQDSGGASARENHNSWYWCATFWRSLSFF